jgi:hypothetical protein
MLNCIYGLEILNEKYDPFSLKLTNWSQQINADISSYYDVFGEIYEKYNKPGKSMSPELKLILMIGGSALKFHLNQVAAQGKLGIPPIFGLQNNASQQPNYSQHNNQTNPQMMEQMRQQAAAQQMIEQTQKQNEILMNKSKNEHELANQQVKDMMFLQQKKIELEKQEEEKQKKIQEFERTKAMFESRNNQQQFSQQQFVQQQFVQQPFAQQQSAYNNMLNSQRRNEISSHLDHMKKNISNLVWE